MLIVNGCEGAVGVAVATTLLVGSAAAVFFEILVLVRIEELAVALMMVENVGVTTDVGLTVVDMAYCILKS